MLTHAPGLHGLTVGTNVSGDKATMHTGATAVTLAGLCTSLKFLALWDLDSFAASRDAVLAATVGGLPHLEVSPLLVDPFSKTTWLQVAD